MNTTHTPNPPVPHQPIAAKAITASEVKSIAAKPVNKQTKVGIERGLYLLLHPNGGRYWRWKYRYGGRERLLALGTYPDITLAVARDLRDQARAKLKQGIDPASEKQTAKRELRESLDNAFARVADDWLRTWKAGKAPGTVTNAERRLSLLVVEIGGRPVAEIEPRELIAALTRIQKAVSAGVAHRVLSVADAVFERAVVCQLVKANPCYGVRKVLQAESRGHRLAQVEDAGLAVVLQKIDGYPSPILRGLLQLLPMLLCRPGELRSMRWDELHGLEGGKPEWRFLAPKTKTERIVPLSRQAVSIIESLRPITGGETYVLAGRSDGKLSNSTLSWVLKHRLGLAKMQMAHGFRATGRTMLDERLGFRVEWIEHQLGHVVKDALGRAYNRTTFIEERRGMMQAWADYLDRLRAGSDEGGNVVPLRRAG